MDNNLINMGKYGKTKEGTKDTPKQHKMTESQKFLKKFLAPAEQERDRVETNRLEQAEGDVQASDDDSTISESNTYALLKTLPTKRDLKDLATQIKTALREEVADLKTEIASLHVRTEAIEGRTEQIEQSVESLLNVSHIQNKAIQSLTRRVEDLDNRGRRCNLRIRGLPETVETSTLKQTVILLFNSVLNKPDTNEIHIERVHRALRPKGLPSDRPRDVICCLLHFTVKDEILAKARQQKLIKLEGVEVSILQDLSWYTLQQRRLLKPLTNFLKENKILFRWGYPFSIQATVAGKLHTLSTPEDLRPFLQACNAPRLDLSDWIKFVHLPTPTPIPHQDPWKEVESPKAKRSRSRQTMGKPPGSPTPSNPG